MTDNQKRRSFPEYAKLLSKEPGWLDKADVLQELLGAFLREQLSDVTWPTGPYRAADRAHVVTVGRDDTGWPMNVRFRTPPQEQISREDWLVAFRSDFTGELGRKCRDLGFDDLAEISITEYPSIFRQAYIEWLYATDAAVVGWLKKRGKTAPDWLRARPKKEQKRSPGRPTLKPKIEDTYRALKKADQIDFRATKTALCKKIREKICRSPGGVYAGPNGQPRGLGNEAIRRVITPLFESDQKKALQPNGDPSKL